MVLSLRDMGYDFTQAVADIVDNSIEAHAHEVRINLEFDADDSWVSIADDGSGMSAEEIREAMRFGADREYSDNDLGKFGLGLKTASFSQCRRLTVLSRRTGGSAQPQAYRWDLEHITKTNRWALLRVDLDEVPTLAREEFSGGTGTVVLWQRLDRILGLKYPQGEVARRRLAQMCRDLEIHLGMVFHRFLTGEVPRRRLQIRVNGNRVKPWDPYCRGEKSTRFLKEIPIELEAETYRGDVELRPYILPAQDAFSSPAAFKEASGPANWNQQQGFYIYRANRMIQSGGWCHFRAPDEHTKLARISIDFSRDLDEAFKLNVPKMRVILPSELRSQIADVITPIVRLARQVYDKGRRRAETQGSPGTEPSPSDSATAGGGLPMTTSVAASGSGPASGAPPREAQASSSDRLTFDEWTDFVASAAMADELPVFRKIVSRARNNAGAPPSSDEEARESN